MRENYNLTNGCSFLTKTAATAILIRSTEMNGNTQAVRDVQIPVPVRTMNQIVPKL